MILLLRNLRRERTSTGLTVTWNSTGEIVATSRLSYRAL